MTYQPPTMRGRLCAIALAFAAAASAVGAAPAAAGTTTTTSASVAAQPPVRPASLHLSYSATRDLAYTFVADIGQKFQLVASPRIGLQGAGTIVRPFTASTGGTQHEVLTVPTRGIWYTAIQQITPTPLVPKDITRVNVGGAPASIVSVTATQSRGRLTLRVPGRSGSIEYRLTAHGAGTFASIVTMPAAITVALPAGRWTVEARIPEATGHLAGLWSAPVSYISNATAGLRPQAIAHAGRDSVGQPRVTLVRKAKTGYWITSGARLLGWVPPSPTSTSAPISVPLSCGATATVTVRSVDARGHVSRPSPSARVNRPACIEPIVPSAPSDIQVQTADDTSMLLTWQPSHDPTATSYLLLRNGVPVGGLAKGTAQSAQSSLTPATDYTWTLFSRDAQGRYSTNATTVTAPTMFPPQSTGDVRAFVFANTDTQSRGGVDGVSLSDARLHYTSLHTIYPTYFHVNEPTLSTDCHQLVCGTSQPRIDRWFQARNVTVVPRIVADDLATLESDWATADSRQAFAAAVADAVELAGADGIHLDIEPSYPKSGAASVPGDTAAARAVRFAAKLTDAVQRIAALMHADNKVVSVAVPTNWCNKSRSTTTWRVDYCSSLSGDALLADASVTGRPRPKLYDVPGLLMASDELWAMIWGQHWSTSEPGASAESDWLDASATWLAAVADRTARDHPDASIAQITFGRNMYAAAYSYKVVGQPITATAPAAFPTLPTTKCSNGSAPRALSRDSGTAGVLKMEWVCPIGFSDKFEYSDALSTITRMHAPALTFSANDGESMTTLTPTTSTDPCQAALAAVSTGALCELWVPDVQSEAYAASVATSYGWHIGLWRLGREDQRIWDLPTLQPMNGGAS